MAITEEMKLKQAQRLKKILKDNKTTQKKLAEMIHISEQSITKWTTGKTAIPADRAIEILNLYPLNPADIPADKTSPANKRFIAGMNYRLEWLLGKDDFETAYIMETAKDWDNFNKQWLLSNGFEMIVNSIGGAVSSNFKEAIENDLNEVFTITYTTERITLSKSEYQTLLTEIQKFTEFKLRQYLTKEG